MADQVDPRFRNDIFDTGSLSAYFGAYADRLYAAMMAVDQDAVDRARQAIEQASAGGNRIFAIGNGGSAAIADHLCCDWTKGTHAHDHPVIDTTSLSANVPLYTALANDFGFETAFAKQISYFAKAGDVLVAISSSGNSPNILAAVAAAKAAGVTTIGLSGFSGGQLREQADIAIHVDVANYGIVEDVHQSVMHIIAQFIAAGRDHRA
ncbi:D-sedoheptulose-7-phosphate isomerase [Sphingobium olei]|uniref:SIS domain-containing protein n=1 Tax=Sphingobium olei TaxID=420955 RepID=A0ABW3P791_9SPHN|nr:SIS domain-containing protein [Sphingobium sp.]